MSKLQIDMDEPRAKEMLIPFRNDGLNLFAALQGIFFYKFMGFVIPFPFRLLTGGLNSHREQVIDKGRPVHAGHVASNIGLDRKWKQDVVSNGMGSKRDVVLHQIEMRPWVLQERWSFRKVNGCR